jgi:hypothetical protein
MRNAKTIREQKGAEKNRREAAGCVLYKMMSSAILCVVLCELLFNSC